MVDFACKRLKLRLDISAFEVFGVQIGVEGEPMSLQHPELQIFLRLGAIKGIQHPDSRSSFALV